MGIVAGGSRAARVVCLADGDDAADAFLFRGRWRGVADGGVASMIRRRSILLLLAGVAIFLATAVCGAGSEAPAPPDVFNTPSGGGVPAPTMAGVLPTLPVTVQPSGGDQATAAPPAPPPAIPESRRVTLEYPPSIRQGDSDVVRLTLEVDSLGNITPTAETQGNTVKGQTVQIPNLYETHNVIAEARLDLAGVDVRPGDVVTEPVLPGQAATFYWSVHPSASGTYRGTAWLFLRFINKATEEESHIPISAQNVEISTSEVLGMGGSLARTAGGVGSVVGAVLGFPFAGDVLKWLWKRIRKGA